MHPKKWVPWCTKKFSCISWSIFGITILNDSRLEQVNPTLLHPVLPQSTQWCLERGYWAPVGNYITSFPRMDLNRKPVMHFKLWPQHSALMQMDFILMSLAPRETSTFSSFPCKINIWYSHVFCKSYCKQRQVTSWPAAVGGNILHTYQVSEHRTHTMLKCDKIQTYSIQFHSPIYLDDIQQQNNMKI